MLFKVNSKVENCCRLKAIQRAERVRPSKNSYTKNMAASSSSSSLLNNCVVSYCCGKQMIIIVSDVLLCSLLAFQVMLFSFLRVCMLQPCALKTATTVNEPIKIFARRLQSCNFQNKRYCSIHNGEKSHDNEILIETGRKRSNNISTPSSVPSQTRTVIVYEINVAVQRRDVSWKRMKLTVFE